VAVEGPNGVSVLMSPEAAEETSHRLLDAATEAAGMRARKTPSPSRSAAEPSRPED
jgi:hypothetical protein